MARVAMIVGLLPQEVEFVKVSLQAVVLIVVAIGEDVPSVGVSLGSSEAIEPNKFLFVFFETARAISIAIGEADLSGNVS